jgi:hypothetical protein
MHILRFFDICILVSDDNRAILPYSLLGKWVQRGIYLDPDIHMIVRVGLALSDDFAELEGIEEFVAFEEELEQL